MNNKNEEIRYFIFLLGQLTACIPVKSIFLGNADSKDLKRFPSHKIEASSNCFEFERADLQDFDFSVNDWTRDKPDFLTLDEFVARHPVRSFLVIQNDSIKYEYYRKDLDTLDLNPSYSMAKSFISALLGIAIDDGLIQSIDDSVLTYMPEFRDVELSDKLTIRHLLNHTSGFKSSVVLDINIYYGQNIMRHLKNMEIIKMPGTHQEYINMNTQIIGIILNRVTGKSIASYMEEKSGSQFRHVMTVFGQLIRKTK